MLATTCGSGLIHQWRFDRLLDLVGLCSSSLSSSSDDSCIKHCFVKAARRLPRRCMTLSCNACFTFPCLVYRGGRVRTCMPRVHLMQECIHCMTCGSHRSVTSRSAGKKCNGCVHMFTPRPGMQIYSKNCEGYKELLARNDAHQDRTQLISKTVATSRSVMHQRPCTCESSSCADATLLPLAALTPSAFISASTALPEGPAPA